MKDLIDVLWGYLLSGNYFQFFVTVFNTYFPYGLFFWLFGFVLFFIIQLKTKSLGFAGVVAASYFVVVSMTPGLVTNAYSQVAMQYFGLLLGMIAGYYLYRGVKG